MVYQSRWPVIEAYTAEGVRSKRDDHVYMMFSARVLCVGWGLKVDEDLDMDMDEAGESAVEYIDKRDVLVSG